MRKIKKRKNKQIKIAIVCIFILIFILTTGYAAFQTNITLTAKGNAKDKSRTIKAWTYTSDEDFHTDYYRENIISATFLDSAKVPNEAVESWDVSKAGDRGVMAYVKSSTEEGKFDLFIGAKRGVIANTNSSYLFYNFKNIKNIEFNNNFNTSKSLAMVRMFGGCKSLSFLNLSSFNTNNVTQINYMFTDCTNLTEIKLDNFNTKNVINMQDMFSNCEKLETIDVSNFNTENCLYITSMFKNCKSLIELDLSSFNTSNIKSLASTFENCINLKTIYVSNRFVTENMTASGLAFNNCNNLVGGNGTTYDLNHTDKEYARIDTSEAPGYFTLKTE